jgi:hypothetical protein
MNSATVNHAHSHAADRVFPDRRSAGTASVVHPAPAHGPMAVKPIAGHGAGGGRQEPGPDAATRSQPGHEFPDGRGRRQSALDHPADRPRQAARPRERHDRAGRLRFSSPGRGRTSLPGGPALYPGVTLSDEGVRENAHGPAVRRDRREVTARSAMVAELGDLRVHQHGRRPGHAGISTLERAYLCAGQRARSSVRTVLSVCRRLAASRGRSRCGLQSLPGAGGGGR